MLVPLLPEPRIRQLRTRSPSPRPRAYSLPMRRPTNEPYGRPEPTVRFANRRASEALARGLGRVLVDLPETELVALRALAHREPAHLRHAHVFAGLAAQLLHPGHALADVVDVEVRADPALAGLHVRHRDAALVVDAGREVLARPRVRLTELPP